MEPAKKNLNLSRRILQLFFGMFVASTGIAVITSARLGTTPISTVPLVTSALTGLTFGQTTFAVNALFFLVQLVLLRKRLSGLIVLQLPVVALFGLFIDLSMGLVGRLGLANGLSYGVSLLMSLTGNVLLAAGIVLQVDSKTIVQPGEGVVLALAVTLRRNFGTVKIWFDVSMVVIASLLGFAFAQSLIGVREGTVISALMIGSVIKLIRRFFPVEKS